MISSGVLPKFISCRVICQTVIIMRSVILIGNISLIKQLPGQILVDSGFIQCQSVLMTDDAVIRVPPVITREPWNLGKECMDKIINDPSNHSIVIPGHHEGDRHH